MACSMARTFVAASEQEPSRPAREFGLEASERNLRSGCREIQKPAHGVKIHAPIRNALERQNTAAAGFAISHIPRGCPYTAEPPLSAHMKYNPRPADHRE